MAILFSILLTKGGICPCFEGIKAILSVLTALLKENKGIGGMRR
jgi:hypothetical protein